MTVETSDCKPHVPGPNAVDISPKKDNGILKEIIREGIGLETPSPGSKVFVHYVGTLTNGTKFDSSRDRGEPFDFQLGKGTVIQAWDIGVATMKKGEVAVLTCKSEYAYGKSGSPPKIPPDATLVFEIEVIDWQGEDVSPKKDGSITRYQLVQGEGYSTPNDGATVEVNLVGTHNGKIFEERSVTFPLGEGSEYGICEGLEKALEKFKKGERSRIIIKPKYAFKKEGRPDLTIPGNAEIEYVVELKNFEKAKDAWALDAGEKIEQAKFFKEKGTNYFKAGKYVLAIKMYRKIVNFLEHETGFEEDKEQERKSLLLAGHLNLAMCYLKLDEHFEAREQCNKALDLQPSTEKGLFRRGQAYLGMGEPELAKTDFEAVLKLEPENKAAANNVVICNVKIKEQRSREKKIYANMFEKFAQRDKEVPSDLPYGWWDGGKVITEKDEELVSPPPPKKSLAPLKKIVATKEGDKDSKNASDLKKDQSVSKDTSSQESNVKEDNVQEPGVKSREPERGRVEAEPARCYEDFGRVGSG